MATAINRGGREFRLGDVFGRAWAVARTAPLPLLGLSLLFGGLTETILGYFLPQFPAAQGDDLAGLAIALLSLVYSFTFVTLLQGATATIAMAHAEGRIEPFGRCFVTALRWFVPILGLTIINVLAVSVGTLLILIPGMIIAVVWSVSGSALVVERIGIFAALGRSRYLTHGARWQVFGLILLIFVAAVAYALLLRQAAIALGVDAAVLNGAATPPLLVSLGTLLLGIPSSVAFSAILAALYVELRYWKDGSGADDLAEIFS